MALGEGVTTHDVCMDYTQGWRLYTAYPDRNLPHQSQTAD